MTDQLMKLWTTKPVLVAAAGVAAAIALFVAILAARRVARDLAAVVTRRRGPDPASGAPLFYVVAGMATAVSVNTSWRFFGDRLHITDVPERIVMFAVLEAALVACAYAMRANVRRPQGEPGAPRTVAWMLTVLSAYMAITESDVWEGVARVALGPVLGIVALHLALGVEIRRMSPEASNPWARLVREMRERVLSRFGLANDDRDAATRTRHRAAVRAARLAAATDGRFRHRRLARAVRVAGVAYDVDARERMLAELAALKSLDALTNLTLPSPWGLSGECADAVQASAGGPDAVAQAGAAGPVESPSVAVPSGPMDGTDGRPAVRPSTRPTRWTSRYLPVRTSSWPRRRVANASRVSVQPRMMVSNRVVRCAVRPPGQDGPVVSGTPIRDRARATARAHADEHGQWLTVNELAALANVSRGTAATALKELRERTSQIHVVTNDHHASTRS